MTDKNLVYYPGHHGPKTRVQMRTGNRMMRFRAGEVRAMPDADARDVINLCGYHRALTATEAAARVSMTADELVAAGGLTTAEYRPQADAKAETVIVLDRPTARRLRELAETATPAEESETATPAEESETATPAEESDAAADAAKNSEPSQTRSRARSRRRKESA